MKMNAFFGISLMHSSVRGGVRSHDLHVMSVAL